MDHDADMKSINGRGNDGIPYNPLSNRHLDNPTSYVCVDKSFYLMRGQTF